MYTTSRSRSSGRLCRRATRYCSPRKWRCSTRWPRAGRSSACCGNTNEMLTYDLNPEESRERTVDGMELILRAWKEPQPFGWQGRHFQYRTVSVWPKPLQQPLPPMYALGTSREASDFAARNHIGLGVSFGPFDVMGKVTGYYKEECARYGWRPEPH